jgi:hypothetical protein
VFYDHLVKLLKELNVEGANAIPRDLSTISLDFDGSPIVITDDPPGLEFSATIGDLPEEHQEAIFLKLLRGNFLGQATKRACLGLDEPGKHIILTASIPTIRSYREFRDALEDFVNTVSFWKREAVSL